MYVITFLDINNSPKDTSSIFIDQIFYLIDTIERSFFFFIYSDTEHKKKIFKNYVKFSLDEISIKSIFDI